MLQQVLSSSPTWAPVAKGTDNFGASPLKRI